LSPVKENNNNEYEKDNEYVLGSKITTGDLLIHIYTKEEKSAGISEIGSVGIGINAASTAMGGLPPQSISLIDMKKINGTHDVHLLLGLLSEDLFLDNNSPLKKSFNNSYGLYCDNVFLKGTMVSAE
jgi:hypothetical protein